MTERERRRKGGKEGGRIDYHPCPRIGRVRALMEAVLELVS